MARPTAGRGPPELSRKAHRRVREWAAGYRSVVKPRIPETMLDGQSPSATD
jgi:hypothetical protein